MKLIHNFKSPNFNERKSNNIKLIIIHYTALKTVSESIKYLCSKKKKVSSHYLISGKGQIYNLVSVKNRAWHAGQSCWKGAKDINSISIGIELDYSPFSINNKFTNELNKSLIYLLKKLVKKYKILPENILGHSDIAPYRKIDPGKYFPWHILEKENLAFKIKEINKNKIDTDMISKLSAKYSSSSNHIKILNMLKYIGYDISLAIKKKSYFNQLINVYCARNRYYKNFVYNKKKIFYVIELHFLNIILTKLKK